MYTYFCVKPLSNILIFLINYNAINTYDNNIIVLMHYLKRLSYENLSYNHVYVIVLHYIVLL